MFKKLLFLLALASTAFGAENLQSKRYIVNNGGLVNHISPLLVPENAATSIQNISMDDRGYLIKRNGYSVVGSTSVFLGFSTWTVNGGGYHRSSSGTDFFAVIVGSTVYRGTNNTDTPAITPVSTGIKLTATPSNQAQVTSFNDVVLFCNEADTVTYVAATGNASNITTTVFSSATTCSTYGNYFVVGDTTETGTRKPNRIRWSNINDQNTFSALDFYDIEPGDGDKIMSMVQWDESVYIFKRRSIWRMLITGDSGANAFIIRPVARNIGAWAKNSVKPIPNVGIAFLAQNTAYLLSDQGLVPIGDPIQRTFDGISRSMWSQAVGGVYPKRYQYWLSVSTAGTTNTEVLIYDYLQKNWTIYDNMTLNTMFQMNDSNGDNVLISGGYTAAIWKQDSGVADYSTGTAVNIQGSYTTGDLFSDSFDIQKNFKYLYLVTNADHNFDVTIETYYDLNVNREGSLTVSVGASSQYDIGLYDTTTYIAGNNVITRYELNRSAKTIKLKFTQSDQLGSFGIVGWTLVYSVEGYTQ